MFLKVYALLEWWIIILNCFLLFSVKGQLCEPCEETMPCNISYTMQDNASILSLSWYSNGNEAMTCYLDSSDCNVYPQYRKLITSLTEEKNRNLTLNLIFLKTGRQINSITIERTWKLIAYYLKLPPKVLFICDLRIYIYYTLFNNYNIIVDMWL
ncbi:uncharacterized protein LOC131956034 [Physella acuta]|uniref:uncharacterized protein LOC131956034 n=1 Tax=Physella acuta TaxID=109671 RepID=UPI0027DCBD30|nr:uncharacterized protein LOC131956034 [Physella acuta]